MLLCLAWLLVLTVGLAAASFDLLTMGIHTGDASPQIATAGETITVTFSFTPSGFGPYFPAAFGCMAVGIYDRVQLMWWTNNNGTGSYQAAVVPCGVFDDNQVENGVPALKTLTFTLPTVPPGRNSFTVGGILYGSDGSFAEVYSDPVFSTGAPAGTYAYISIEENHPPYASDVAISNPEYAKLGQVLQGSYSYHDEENDPESGTSFRWLRSTSTDPFGSYSAITGATSQAYTLQSADLGRFIKFEVTPRAASGQLNGSPVLSDHSYQVTASPTIAIDPATVQISESEANDGSITGSILVNLSNADFVADVSGVTISNLPPGLSVNGISTLSASRISVQIQGNAVYHEQGASILNSTLLRITVPASQMIGVSTPRTTPTGFTILYQNNPVTNLAEISSCYNRILIGWNDPSGLLASGSALLSFRIFRDNVLISTMTYVAGTAPHYYNDTSVITGTSHTYRVVANYSNTTDAQDPADTVDATALAITAYSFAALGVSGSIDHPAKMITLYVPASTNLSNLVASFTAPGSPSVRIGGVNQISGVTANDFSNSVSVPLVYTLMTDDSVCQYSVRVYTVLPAPLLMAGNLTTTSFQGRWDAVAGANGYEVDASTDIAFGSYLSGYQGFDNGAQTNIVINALSADTQYYYRVKALAPVPGMNSPWSLIGLPHTLPVGPGTGGTEFNGSDPTPVNLGQFSYGSETVNPGFSADPVSFIPAGNNLLDVFMSYGTGIEGLIYNLSFDNPSLGRCGYTMSYDGLSYDPREVGYRIGGGPVIWVPGGIDPVNRLFTVNLDLDLGTKGIHNLQLIANNGSDPTLPIVLSSFTATPTSSGYIRITWVTQSETNLQGFLILKGSTDNLAEAEVVSPMIEPANSSATTEYVWEDTDVEPGLYYYWLQNLDLDGGSAFYGPVSVLLSDEPETPAPQIPLVTRMRQAFPNPFNPNITIQYDIAEAGPVDITIFNARGQKVRNLVSETKTPASYTANWDGRDGMGRMVATGVYVIRMQAANYQKIRKVTLMK